MHYIVQSDGRNNNIINIYYIFHKKQMFIMNLTKFIKGLLVICRDCTKYYTFFNFKYLGNAISNRFICNYYEMMSVIIDVLKVIKKYIFIELVIFTGNYI